MITKGKRCRNPTTYLVDTEVTQTIDKIQKHVIKQNLKVEIP
jgi:hypothetical protein